MQSKLSECVTWPFAVWGFDMVGPFRRSSNGKTHLLVMVDKFTKWIEAEPVGDCEAETTVKFLKKVIFRFGYPHSIITDNGSNTSEGATQIFYADNGIRLEDRKSTRLNSSHSGESRMPSSA